MSKTRTILCFFDYFYPAFKSGGPARSALGLAEVLNKAYKIKIITRDRDKEDVQPMNNIVSNTWNTVKNIEVFYWDTFKYRAFTNAVRESNTDLYYVNSFFSFRFSILPLLLIKSGILPKRKVVLAPRGEFSTGAIGLKKRKKMLFIFIFRPFYNGIIFQASSALEDIDIKKIFPRATVKVALNLRSPSEFSSLRFQTNNKEESKLKVVYLSRIDRKKNLEYSIDVISKSKNRIELDIYGSIDDANYWRSCLRLIEIVNVEKQGAIRYCGVVQPDQVNQVIAQYDLMILTTLGENFSHAILDSFMASRPVLIANTTYWTNLVDAQAGWDLPLDAPRQFIDVLDRLSDMQSNDFERFCTGAYRVAENYFNNPKYLEDYKKLFD